MLANRYDLLPKSRTWILYALVSIETESSLGVPIVFLLRKLTNYAVYYTAWIAGAQETGTHLTRLRKSTYQRRRAMIRHLLKDRPFIFDQLSNQQLRRSLLFSASQVSSAETSGGLVFNSASFIAVLGNSTGMTSTIGQASLQVLKLYSAASKQPAMPSAFSTILAGIYKQYQLSFEVPI